MQNIYQNELVVPKGILMAIGGKESKGNNQPENKEAPDKRVDRFTV